MHFAEHSIYLAYRLQALPIARTAKYRGRTGTTVRPPAAPASSNGDSCFYRFPVRSTATITHEGNDCYHFANKKTPYSVTHHSSKVQLTLTFTHLSPKGQKRECGNPDFLT